MFNLVSYFLFNICKCIRVCRIHGAGKHEILKKLCHTVDICAVYLPDKNAQVVGNFVEFVQFINTSSPYLEHNANVESYFRGGNIRPIIYCLDAC